MRRGNGSKHVPAKCAATVAQQGRASSSSSSGRRESLHHIELNWIELREREREKQRLFERKFGSRVLEGVCLLRLKYGVLEASRCSSFTHFPQQYISLFGLFSFFMPRFFFYLICTTIIISLSSLSIYKCSEFFLLIQYVIFLVLT